MIAWRKTGMIIPFRVSSVFYVLDYYNIFSIIIIFFKIHAWPLIRISIFSATVTCLCSCNSAGQPRNASLMERVPADQSFVMPPPGGPAIVDVVEQRYPNATQQRILLAGVSKTQGQNYLLVQYFGPVGTTGQGRTALKNRPLSTTNLAAELREEFPGFGMSRSPVFVQNRYGPFGYAVGRSPAGDICLYAWQRIFGASSLPILFRAKGTIQIRLRQCGTVASENRLLSTMYGMSIKSFFSDINWNPYGSAPGPNPSLGASGEPIYPIGASGFEPLVEADPEPAQRPVKRRASKPRALRTGVVAQPQPLPAPIGVPVPPPPGSPQSPTTNPSPGSAQPSGAINDSSSVSGPPVPPPPGASN